MGALMAAYVIVNITVTDPVRYAGYVKATPATLAPYGGRFLVRGGPAALLEGGWEPKRIVVLEFDSLARARAWYDSEDYAGPKALRQAAAVTDMILVEGIATGPPAAR
jgi:uncharacterized protein (DUF1330 family)